MSAPATAIPIAIAPRAHGRSCARALFLSRAKNAAASAGAGTTALLGRPKGAEAEAARSCSTPTRVLHQHIRSFSIGFSRKQHGEEGGGPQDEDQDFLGKTRRTDFPEGVATTRQHPKQTTQQLLKQALLRERAFFLRNFFPELRPGTTAAGDGVPFRGEGGDDIESPFTPRDRQPFLPVFLPPVTTSGTGAPTDVRSRRAQEQMTSFAEEEDPLQLHDPAPTSLHCPSPCATTTTPWSTWGHLPRDLALNPVQFLEIRGAPPLHVFVTTQDRLGRRVEHHFFVDGYRVREEGSLGWGVDLVPAPGCAADKIKSTDVQAGPNCGVRDLLRGREGGEAEARPRQGDAAAVVAGEKQLLWLRKPVVSSLGVGPYGYAPKGPGRGTERGTELDDDDESRSRGSRSPSAASSCSDRSKTTSDPKLLQGPVGPVRGLSVGDVRSAVLSAGIYRLWHNNCFHACARVWAVAEELPSQD